MSISDKLTYLNETKQRIKESINLTNANITNEPFRQYAVILKNRLPEIVGNPSIIWNNYEHVTGSGTSFSINAYNSIFKYSILGNTSQNGTPTPDAPIPINVVSGNNTININSNAYPINLGVTNLYNKYDDFNYPTTGWSNETSLQPDGTIKTAANFSISSSRGIKLTLEKNTVYSVSGILISSTGDLNDKAVVRIMGYSSSWRAITNNNLTKLGYFSFTFNSGNNNNWFLSLNSNGTAGQNFQAIFNNIQVEKGSNANSYTDYYTIPIELCNIPNTTYRDRIFKAVNGDEYYDSLTQAQKDELTYGAWYLHKEVGKITSYNGETISTDYISTTGELTIGATVYYVLATPTNTEITDSHLLLQLDNLKLDNGLNNIITVGSDLNPILNIEAIKYLD